MKRLLKTFLAIVDAMILAAALFFNVIPGAFGLAATSCRLVAAAQGIVTSS
jgi:hypothetical protein